MNGLVFVFVHMDLVARIVRRVNITIRYAAKIFSAMISEEFLLSPGDLL